MPERIPLYPLDRAIKLNELKKGPFAELTSRERGLATNAAESVYEQVASAIDRAKGKGVVVERELTMLVKVAPGRPIVEGYTPRTTLSTPEELAAAEEAARVGFYAAIADITGFGTAEKMLNEILPGQRLSTTLGSNISILSGLSLRKFGITVAPFAAS